MKYDFVHNWFEAVAALYPDQTAISEGKKAISYSELSAASGTLSHNLNELAGTGKLIATLQPKGAGLITSLLGIFKSRNIYLPLSFELAANRMAQILDQCKPDIIIIDQSDEARAVTLLTDLAAYPVRLLSRDDDGSVKKGVLQNGLLNWEDNQPAKAESTEGESSDKAYVFYTSGSTGTAKGILGSHRSLAHFIDWEIGEFALKPGHKVSHLVNPLFDASLRDIFVPLCSGGTLCIPPANVADNPALLSTWLNEEEVSLIHCVPSLFRILTDAAEDGKQAFRHLKYVLISGEALYTRDITAWRKKVGEHVQLVNLYGATETTLIKTFHRIGQTGDNPSQVIPVGKPISKTVVAIVNNKHLCREGELGEIYIKTPFWSKGYLDNEPLTKKVFVQNPLLTDREDIVYKTGDLGQYLKDGTIEVRGRLDQQVKVNGIRVELGEIEQAILNIPGIAQVLTIGHVNGQGNTELLAYYTGEEITQDDLRTKLLPSLNQNIIPAYFQHLNEFPTTITGKIDRKALPKPSELLQNNVAYEPPHNETETRLEEIWKRVLDVDRSGRNTSFLTIGGTSLKVIQLVSRIYKEFGVLVKAMDIFANPTIAGQAILLDGNEESKVDEIVPVAERDRYPATYHQRSLWVANQFEEKVVTYNMPYAFRLTGPVDIHAILAAVDRLVSRHESLRTTFMMDDEKVFQKINSAGFSDKLYMFIDVSLSDNSGIDAERLLKEHANYPFDLEKGPLFIIRLIRLSQDDHILFLNAHHIIGDAWSMQVIARDFLQYYLTETGEGTVPDKLTIQYKDYAVWVNNKLETQGAESKKYWLEQYTHEVPELTLPTDYPRPDRQTFNGKKLHFSLGGDLSEKIKKRSEASGLTVFIQVLTAVRALLYYYSGQKDVVIGVPVTGRHHQSLEDQVGFYINTLPLRLAFDQNIPYSELSVKVKENFLKGFNHYLYPLDKLIEDLQLGSDLGRTTLFDVMVQIQDAHLSQLAWEMPDGLTLTPVDVDFRSSKFDLTFNVEVGKDDGIITGWIEYNTSLFEENTIDEMQEVLKYILDTVTSETSTYSVSELKKLLIGQFHEKENVKTDAFSAERLSEDF
ncbi:MAG: amino acid adenylation domain-containing protein [Cyclobacteriaceae bacterium]